MLDWAVQGAARWCVGVVVVLPSAQAAGENAWRPSESSGGSSGGGCLEGVGVAGQRCRWGRLEAVGVVRCRFRGRWLWWRAACCVPTRCAAGSAGFPTTPRFVLVHDGARPLASDGMFGRVIAAVRAGADAAVPVVDVTDTIRWRGGGTADTPPAAAVQTPQAFRAGVLRAAHGRRGPTPTDGRHAGGGQLARRW